MINQRTKLLVRTDVQLGQGFLHTRTLWFAVRCEAAVGAWEGSLGFLERIFTMFGLWIEGQLVLAPPGDQEEL